MPRVPLGAYMWHKGLNWVKAGSKWAHFTCLCTLNGPRPLSEKHVFGPFYTHFWSLNGPFAKHFAIFHGLERVNTGSKWTENTCLSISNGAGSLLKKCVVDPLLTYFWSQNGPLSRQYGIFHSPKCVTTGSKRAKKTCLSIPNGLGSLLEESIFDPFLTHFWSQNSPFSRHFGILHGSKRITTGSKRAKITCLSITSGLGTSLEKMFSSTPRDCSGPTIGPHCVRAKLPSLSTK